MSPKDATSQRQTVNHTILLIVRHGGVKKWGFSALDDEKEALTHECEKRDVDGLKFKFWLT